MQKKTIINKILSLKTKVIPFTSIYTLFIMMNPKRKTFGDEEKYYN